MDDIDLSLTLKAIDAAGGVSAVADAFKISVQAVYKWIKAERVPHDRCIAIESMGQRAVTRYQLRPDVFGEAPQ